VVELTDWGTVALKHAAVPPWEEKPVGQGVQIAVEAAYP
jgi:hypothetical protein